MAWIDFRKAYNMLPRSGVIKSLEVAGAAKNIVNLLKETMKNWKTNLFCSNTDKKVLKSQTDRVNEAIKYLKSKSITETNNLSRAASVWTDRIEESRA